MGRVRDGFVKVAAATPHVKVGNCDSNIDSIITLAQQASERGASIVLFPELSVTGYSCGDLFRQQGLLSAAEEALQKLVCSVTEAVVVVGMPIIYNSALYNCAVVVCQGVICGVVAKSYNTDTIFNSGRGIDNRYITLCDQMVPFGSDMIFSFEGVKFSIEIGQDSLQIIPPSAETASAGANIALCLSAESHSQGSVTALKERIAHHSARIAGGYILAAAGYGESTTDFVYTPNAIIAERGDILASNNPLNRNSELVVADIDIEAIEAARMAAHSTNLCDCYRVLEVPANITDSPIERKVDATPFIPANLDEGCAEVLELQAAGLCQRLEHTHCKSVVIGISGGLDSTLALLVVVKAFDILSLDRKCIIGVTMPGFGTTDRTYNNALVLMQELGITIREISICAACEQHFKDIELDPSDRSVAYENSQARERTQILMDIANSVNGMVIGTGDLSESALGWATYNGDHMSMYNVNCSVPKTLVRAVTTWAAEQEGNIKVKTALKDIVSTPVSPELLPADEKGNITQKTEDLVGPYELHDFFLYHFIINGFSPKKILLLAKIAFKEQYDQQAIVKWLTQFLRRFFSQQYKRSAVPDGLKVTAVSLSPRGAWRMPSDAVVTQWLQELK